MALLVLGIAITVGLSVMSRSVTEVSISTTSDEAARALEAAEAGVERSLGGIIAGPSGAGTVPTTNSSYSVNNSSVAGTSGTAYAIPYRIANGDVASVYLQGVNSAGAAITYSGSLRICWGQSGSTPAAIETILYYREAGVVRVGRNGYDSSGRGGFAGTDGAGGCSGYATGKLVSMNDLGMPSGTPLLLRIRTLYNTTAQPILVEPQGGTLPVQGKDVISTGQSGTATQKLHVIQTNPDLPFMFDMALFSGQSLVQ